MLTDSRLELIKRFIHDRPWWEFKISRDGDKWRVVMVNHNHSGPLSVQGYEHADLGEAMRQLCVWIGVQNAIQKRETTTVPLAETSDHRKKVVERVREQPDRSAIEAEGK